MASMAHETRVTHQNLSMTCGFPGRGVGSLGRVELETTKGRLMVDVRGGRIGFLALVLMSSLLVVVVSDPVLAGADGPEVGE